MIRWFAGHPTAANLLMVGFLVVGIAFAPTLQRETFPDFQPDRVEARVVYPGASAVEVEQAICQRLEDALEGVTYLKETVCTAREGVGVAVAEMLPDGAIGAFLNDVKTEVEAIDSFPDEAEAPTVRRLNTTDKVISIAITGPMTADNLKVYAEQIRDRLTRLPDISQVTLDGFSTRQIRIEPREHMLRQYGLSLPDIAELVARQSVDRPAGDIKTDERDILVRFTDERRTPQSFENLIVLSGEGGAEVRLGEIAEISYGFETVEQKIIFNGERAAVLRVVKTKIEDSLVVVAAVQRFLADLRTEAPPGVSFTLTEDVSSIVQDRLSLLIRNGIQGLALVFAVMCLFFTVRFSFWVAMGLPVSFLGTLAVMALLGLSINMITMVGLLIAIGLLMDDAIVISESIAASRRDGATAVDAAVSGLSRVGPGVFASFATTVAVFTPLAFLSGQIGRVLEVMPVVLVSVLVVSLVEAFLILPHHLTHALEKDQRKPRPRWRQRFDDGFVWLRDHGIGPLVTAAVRLRYLTAGVAVCAFLVSISMLAGGQLKTAAFPDLDGDVLEARILLAPGTPLARTEAVVDQVTAALDRTNTHFKSRQPNQQDLVRNVLVRFAENPDATETGPHLATVSVDLLSAEVRDASIDAITRVWRTEIGGVADALAVILTEPSLGPAGKAIQIELKGDDPARLDAAAAAVRTWLAGFPGVVDLQDDLRPGKPELRFTLREGAADLGLSAALIAEQLAGAFQGLKADDVQVGSESFEIEVNLPEVDRNSLTALDYFVVMAPAEAGGAAVPLSTVTSVEEGRGWAALRRIDGVRTATVSGDVHGINANEVMARTEVEFFAGPLAQDFPDISVSLGGTQEEQADTRTSMIRGFLLGLVAVFLLLSLQFRSYIEPAVVMLAIPLGLIGVIWGHLLMGLELTMPSIMGFISLSGIVVNNAILIVEFTKAAVAEGLPPQDALKRAARERFRAIFITTLTTLAGIFPLLLERSLQAQVLIPLVTSLGFGLLAATVLVLLVVPAFYAILADLGLARILGRTAKP